MYPKLTTQNYENLGGVNEKVSEYVMNLTQFLNLRNLEFNTPGSLNKRPGSTQALQPGGIVSGVNSIYEFNKLDGTSYLVFGTPNEVRHLVGNGYTVISNGWTSLSFTRPAGQPIDFVTFFNNLFMANGVKFEYWDGSIVYDYGMPIPPALNRFGGLSFNAMGVTGFGVGQSLFWGVSLGTLDYSANNVFVGYAYLRGSFTEGFQHGPISWTNMQLSQQFGSTSSFNGSTQKQGFTVTGFTFPNDIGVSYYALYAYYGTTPDAPAPLASNNFYDTKFYAWLGVGSVNATALSFTFGNSAIMASGGYTSMILGYGWTAGIGSPIYNAITGSLASGLQFIPAISLTSFYFSGTYTPKFIDLGNNSLFLSGMTNAPSTVFFTDPGAPYQINPENNFEVRTNDGDKISGQVFYNGQLIIFKEKSFHKLVGESADNYELIEITNEYGCLCNSSIVEYKDKLLFLDAQGIVEFNGVNWNLISTDVEDTFKKMNILFAKDNARGVHYKERNQVWFAIPIDDAAIVSNIVVVFDYVVGAWTFFDGIFPTALSEIKGGLPRPAVWRGDVEGGIYYHSPSFMSDAGSAFTCLALTRFESPDGKNITNIWRRLFLDVATVAGSSTPINVEVFKDYDRNNVQATFQIFQNQFQTRKEFGVPAKSCAFQFSFVSASYPLLINGYVAARRYLRDV